MGKTKYIEAEDLMRRMYERAFETDGDTMWQSGCWVRYRAIEAVVKETPAADVVEVVRCKDCKHSEEFIYPKGLETMVCWENNADREVNRNGFCEKGERKDG